MRRILLLLTDLEIGGTPTIVRELAVRLAREPDAAVTVACLARWGPVAEQLRRRGVKVTALDARGMADVGVVWRLVRLMRDEGIDTVLSFLVHANAVAAVASLAAGNVRFFQSIQTTQARPRWHWMIQSIVHGAAERVIVPSASVAAAAREWAGVPEEKIVVIANAVEMGEFCGEGSRKEGRRSPPLRSPGVRFDDAHRRPGEGVIQGSGRVGFIGRLDPVKRVGDLVRAMALLERGVTLDIFGEGIERRRIQADIERLKLSGRVTLHGAIEGAAQALAGMDLLVLPSESEGFGLVLIEAMAAGVPVIGTNVPGIRDVIVDGRNGLLTPVGNPGALATVIGKVLSDASLRERLVGGGKEAVAAHFTWERVYGEYREILRLNRT